MQTQTIALIDDDRNILTSISISDTLYVYVEGDRDPEHGVDDPGGELWG